MAPRCTVESERSRFKTVDCATEKCIYGVAMCSAGEHTLCPYIHNLKSGQLAISLNPHVPLLLPLEFFGKCFILQYFLLYEVVPLPAHQTTPLHDWRIECHENVAQHMRNVSLKQTLKVTHFEASFCQTNCGGPNQGFVKS
jgi:hypothetical protein